MSYPYFFIDKDAVQGDSITIAGEDYRHLVKVLRARIGDRVEISDNEDTRYMTMLDRVKKTSASLKILDRSPIKLRIPEINLFLCILKKDAMELAIQKNTEIGANAIIPVFSRRVVVEISGKKRKERLSRWKQIAYNASKQSKRDFICKVLSPITIDRVEPEKYDLFFLPWEDRHKSRGKDTLSAVLDYFRNKNIKKPKKIAFMVGPEGGFEDSEISQMTTRGSILINFGMNVLRSETASIYFASIIDFLLKVSNEKDLR